MNGLGRIRNGIIRTNKKVHILWKKKNERNANTFGIIYRV